MKFLIDLKNQSKNTQQGYHHSTKLDFLIFPCCKYRRPSISCPNSTFKVTKLRMEKVRQFREFCESFRAAPSLSSRQIGIFREDSVIKRDCLGIIGRLAIKIEFVSRRAFFVAIFCPNMRFVKLPFHYLPATFDRSLTHTRHQMLANR